MKRNIQWTIITPMDFPNDWNDELIDFHLNESSWCSDNLINILQKLSDQYGCICNFCTAQVIPKGKEENNCGEIL